MILGPAESYELYLHMGKPPMKTPESERVRIASRHLMLDLPQAMQDQEHILTQPAQMNRQTLENLRELGLEHAPYSALVSAKNLRRSADKMVCLIFGKKLPPKSILNVVGDVHMLCPALTLMLLAKNSGITDEQLVFAAFQLCSRFAYDRTSQRELLERASITSASNILAYFDEIVALNDGRAPQGLRRIRRLLPLVHDKTRSPREIANAIMMSLPRSRGGLGLPEYEVNKVVNLSWEEKLMLGKRYLEVDFAWGLLAILEYNGGVHIDQRGPDSMRTNVLRDKGFVVEELSKEVFDNFDSYLKLMRRFELPLGFKIRKDANSLAAQRTLHARVLALANSGGRIR